jgi:B12-binding domain/radical SAM domain protein
MIKARSKPDLILLHSPSVYDFRKRSILYGPVSDLVPSGPIFEMYPIGLTAIQEYLGRYGYKVRIINLALLMLKNPNFDPEKLIKNLETNAFGIDLHWLPHAQGSLEIAKIVKQHHPLVPTIFGGLSSSYYHRELIDYPQVDYVIRGDSTEEPTRLLMDAILKKEDPYDIPNVTWKKDKVYENPFTYIPEEIDNVCLDYRSVFKSVIRYRDLTGHLPFSNWLEYPITAAVTCRGCDHPCVVCGGSAFSFKEYFNRKKTAFRSPEKLYEDIKSISQKTRGPIFVLGDIRHSGVDNADHILNLTKPLKLKNQIALELFTPAYDDYFKKIKNTFPHYSIEMSIESHDEEIRQASGKYYKNEEVYKTIEAALNNGCERFDIFFLIGLPKQTKEKAIETVKWCDELYEKFNGDKRIWVFTSPVGPFLDPGSIAFEFPEKHGYKILFKSLEEHREALLQPSWKHTLNYETEWMTKDDIVDATYQAGLGLNEVKRNYGLISKKAADRTAERISIAIELMEKIDKILDISDSNEKEEAIDSIKRWVNSSSISTVCEKKELEWPVKRAFNFKVLNIIKTILKPS